MAPNHNGAWPSQKLIEARLGCKERTIRNAIAELFERGWLFARRGGFEGKNGELRKSGFRASYTYIMTVHPAVLAEVLLSEQERVAAYREEVQSVPYRQKVAALLLGAIPAESCRVDRQEFAAHTGKNLPLIPAESCRIIYSENLSSEPVHGISEEKRLGETVQDETQGDHSVSISELHSLLGEGDEAVGIRRASRLSKGRLAYLAEQIELEGIVGAASDIQSAIRLALTLKSKPKTEVSP